MKRFIILIFLFILFKTNAQNLVPNPSFETITSCDSLAGGVYYGIAPPWDAPAGSPDLFDTCDIPSLPSCGVPSNFAGYQYPHLGHGYAGAEFFQLGTNTFREYIQVHLDSILIIQHKYCIEFYVSLSSVYACASNNIGIYFSNIHTLGSGNNRLNLIPQILDTNIISDTTNWVLISGEYIANGGEQYIIIGNFNTAATTNSLAVNGSIDSYYFLDDVSVWDCTGSGLGVNELTKGNSNYKIYPNPNGGEMQLFYNLSEKDSGYITIYDLLGQQVNTYKLISDASILKINERQLQNGIYFYQVYINNNKVYSDKIILIK